MSINRYIGVPFTTDPRDIMDRCFAYLQAKIPGWTPAEGNLDVWLIEAFANEAADIATLATEVPKSVYRYMGSQLFEVAPINGAAATVPTTWTLADVLGHTISAGTQVGIRDSGGNLIPFYVLSDVIVPAGSGVTAVGQVVLVAASIGASGTGLGSIGGNVELIDSVAWVTSIAQTALTAGGADAETDDAYLDRLTLELRTLSPRPILPNDFAIIARDIAGVQRAVAIDGYNPADGTFNNQRMITIAAVDVAGVPVSGAIKAAIQALLDSMREINFIVNTVDPIVSQIDVTTHVKLSVGYLASDVAARIVTAVRAYLSPASWGIARTDDPTDPQTWNNQSIIRYDDLVTIVRNVAGVEYIIDLTVGLHGGAMNAVDLNLTGVVPLPTPNTITAVAS